MKIIKTALFATALLALAVPALAAGQDAVNSALTGDALNSAVSQLQAQNFGYKIGAGLAAIGGGLAVLGAGVGIGRIGATGAEATARQPEAGGRIFTLALITAAFIEGVALFALVVALGAAG
jgi:F-type H+-transporting ATPase subunit c